MNTCMLSLQSWPTLCDPLDHSPPVSSVHGILQARILEWVAMLCPPPWILPDLGIEPASLALQANSFPLSHWGRPIINCIPFPPPPKMCAFLRKNKANALSTQHYYRSSMVWPLGSKVLPGPCHQVTKFSRLIPAGPSLPGGWGRPR